MKNRTDNWCVSDCVIDGSGASLLSAPAIDWRLLGEQRLKRLVEVEHDYAVVTNRFAALQMDYIHALQVNEVRLQRIQSLEHCCKTLEVRLKSVAEEYDLMQVAFL